MPDAQPHLSLEPSPDATVTELATLLRLWREAATADADHEAERLGSAWSAIMEQLARTPSTSLIETLLKVEALAIEVTEGVGEHGEELAEGVLREVREAIEKAVGDERPVP